MIKNATYKGITLFLVELRKHLQQGTLGSGFWCEMTGRTALVIHYEFKGVKHETLYHLVNWYIENHKDVSDEEFNELVNYIRSAFWILDRSGFFMLEIDDDKEINNVTVSNDSVPDEKDTTVDSVDSLPEETEEQVSSKEDNEPQKTNVDYNTLSDDELLALAKEAKIKGAHNMKREKMIAKLSEKSI